MACTHTRTKGVGRLATTILGLFLRAKAPGTSMPTLKAGMLGERLGHVHAARHLRKLTCKLASRGLRVERRFVFTRMEVDKLETSEIKPGITAP